MLLADIGCVNSLESIGILVPGAVLQNATDSTEFPLATCDVTLLLVLIGKVTLYIGKCVEGFTLANVTFQTEIFA